MAKIKTSVHFKHYNSSENLLLPPSLDELIGPKDLVRVVSAMIDRWDISGLINQYCGGGTSSYHPRMLLKILLYGYCCKIYTGRKIARALTKDIHFMWLSAQNRPDFRTINNFRSGRAKETIEALFSEMLKCLMEDKYVTMENYFCDGSTFAADSNKNKMVWKKSAIKYKALAEEKCRELFREIDGLNEAEHKTYGDKNLEETGDQAEEITPEKIEERTKSFNEVIEKTTKAKVKRKAASLKKHLAEQKEKIVKYQEQIDKAGDRGGYNKTDEDATAMRMKNEEILPAYNVMAGSENQFIVNCSVHQNTNDGTCFKAHLDQLDKHSAILPENIIADSIFGTEENYEALEQKGIGNFLKYPAIHREEMPRYTSAPFSVATFKYDQTSDSYICPNNKFLVFKKTEKQEPRKSGYQSTVRIYECGDCMGCSFYKQCCEAAKQTIRQLKINQKLDVYKKKAAENLRSPEGWVLRKRRNIEIESCFGDIKHNMGVRRCHLRGLAKVKTDFCLISMAHNLIKIHLIKQKIAR
jgi:transposase